eukprot:m.173200 g.173200  ORF g.173200 m.173200 type:complete len:658 (+) comp24311_c0_seq2:237-2210(+)
MRTVQKISLILAVTGCIAGTAFLARKRSPKAASALYKKGADALAAVRWTDTDTNSARLHNIEVQAQRQEDANKALEGVYDQLDVRRRELIRLEEDLRLARVKRGTVEEEVALARVALSGLRRNVSHMKVEKVKVAKEHDRAVAKHEEHVKAVSEAEAKKLADESFKAFAFNEYKSSLIPVDREIPDTRVQECQAINWDIPLPKTSIIICFVDESWSALIRTIYSVINRAPHDLIEEIILVDDGSEAAWLGGKAVPRLRDYVRTTLPKTIKYRIITSPKRLGLIRARLLGAKNAIGPVYTFLDSHVEANRDWAQPILALIQADHRTVVTPVIDTIDAHTMAHASFAQRVPAVGTFSWTMDFAWKSGVIKNGDKVTDAVDSPTMAGGLFSIHKDYFAEIGTYDADMDGWGGENLEISFRIWTCGGKLVTAPCSHFGHIFRETHPYTIPGSSIHETFIRNSARVAEVWMDDYKKYFYQSRANTKIPEFGNVSKRVALRKQLECKPFKWYLDTLLPNMFIPDEAHIKNMGAIRNPARGQCIDKMGQRAGGKAGVYFCHGQGGNQAFMYTVDDEIRSTEELCLDAWSADAPGEVFLQRCHGAKGNQEFKFRVVKEGISQIVHQASGHCLEVREVKSVQQLNLMQCEPSKDTQLWQWSSVQAA